jgi:hypothetical protein
MRSGQSWASLAALLCVLVACSSAAGQGTPAPSQYKVVCGSDCLQEFAERFLYALTHGSGGIQLYAAVIESGLPSMLAARLKVENRQLIEIENLRTPAKRRRPGHGRVRARAADLAAAGGRQSARVAPGADRHRGLLFRRHHAGSRRHHAVRPDLHPFRERRPDDPSHRRSRESGNADELSGAVRGCS